MTDKEIVTNYFATYAEIAHRLNQPEECKEKLKEAISLYMKLHEEDGGYEEKINELIEKHQEYCGDDDDKED